MKVESRENMKIWKRKERCMFACDDPFVYEMLSRAANAFALCTFSANSAAGTSGIPIS